MKKTTEKPKWYSKMSASELDALAAGLDGGIDFSETKPLTAAMRAQESRARRKGPGRPRVGQGAKKLQISMEMGLLKRVDSYARAHGLSRSDLIARSLKRELKAG
jgi:hypothetical protein